VALRRIFATQVGAKLAVVSAWARPMIRQLLVGPAPR
jgi:hypothetical protein